MALWLEMQKLDESSFIVTNLENIRYIVRGVNDGEVIIYFSETHYIEVKLREGEGSTFEGFTEYLRGRTIRSPDSQSPVYTRRGV